MHYQHRTLAAGGWSRLSLAEQLGNIGSEVERALQWREKDQKLYRGAVSRVFELLDFTIRDARWRTRLKELMRVREVLADAVLGGKEYKSSLEDIEGYFFQFALAARIRK